MTKQLILLTTLLLSIFNFNLSAKSCDPNNDYQVLREFYLQTNGDTWDSKFAWPDAIFFSSNPNLPAGMNMEIWSGITLNTNGCVSIFKMPLNNVNGPIPAKLSELNDLTYLNLSNNPLGGTIPTDLQYLENLRYLGLSDSQLSGSIPVELSKLTKLEELYLQMNDLSGNIPVELGDLTLLEGLSLYENQLVGSIPTALGDLTKLKFLLTYDNQLSGCYDPALDKLCQQLGTQSLNQFISDGNSFNQTWEDFCTNGAGACELPGDPPCDGCVVRVELVEYNGNEYIVHWADNAFCSDAQTIAYDPVNGSVFCKQGGIIGETGCTDLINNYTVIEILWSKGEDCNNCCDNFTIYGDANRNVPIAIKHYDDFTYVAGTIKTDSVYATFTKFDATNNVVWEKRFSQSSSIFDFVKTDQDEFLLVGRTEPIYDNGIKNNRSILARIDDMGNEVFIRTYDNGQRENFAKIVEHPQAVDSNNPYYIAAYENVGDQSPSAKDEVQLYNLNANGDINWETVYTSISNNLDDQFARNLVCTADGNLLLIGDIDGSKYIGALLSVSGVNGKVISSLEGDNNTLFYDAKELSAGNIVLAGSSFDNGAPQFAFLLLLDNNLNIISSEVFEKNQVKNITTLQVDAQDDLFGVGQLKSGLPCIVKMEVISSQVIVNEVKSIRGNATEYTAPAAHHLTNSTLYYADGRDEKTTNDIDMFIGYFDTTLADDCLEDFAFVTDPANYRLSELIVNIADHNLPVPYNTIDLIDVRLPIARDCEEASSTCCVDEAAFISRTENILTNAPDLEECELFITITTLTECDQVTIDWGEGSPEGPFTGNVIETHTYPSAGVYEVCLRYEEIDEDGTVCWEAVNCFEVNANCESNCSAQCSATNTLNISTGIDALGNELSCGTSVVDPFWRLINNPLIEPCNNPLVSTINGNAYVMNYNNIGANGWANQPGTGTIAPIDGGCNTNFGCNNLKNADGDYLPYIFERTFCICEDDSIFFDLNIKADDRLSIELWDLASSTLITADSGPFNFQTSNNWNFNTFLPSGSYALRANLVNTHAVVLGFSIAGSITSLSNQQSIVQDTTCCESNTINVRKILDNNCNGEVDATDQVGMGWQFELRDIAGTLLQTATTNTDGELFFNNVLAADYTITEVLQPGWVYGTPASGIETITVVNGGLNVVEFFNCPAPIGNCCIDEAAFIDRTDDIITNAPDLEDCELFITTTELTECDQVTIDWGDGSTEGPYTGNINLRHIYTTPGTYTVCLYFVEIDDAGNACWEAVNCFEVNANCEPNPCDCCDEISALQDQVNSLEDKIDILTDAINQLLGNENRIGNNIELKLYPNPNNGNFYVEYNLKERAERVDIVVTDIRGVEIISKPGECTTNCSSQVQLPNNLSDGIYYCTLFADGKLIDSVSFVYKK